MVVRERQSDIWRGEKSGAAVMAELEVPEPTQPEPTRQTMKRRISLADIEMYLKPFDWFSSVRAKIRHRKILSRLRPHKKQKKMKDEVRQDKGWCFLGSPDISPAVTGVVPLLGVWSCNRFVMYYYRYTGTFNAAQAQGKGLRTVPT